MKRVEARLREIQPLIKNISNYQKLKLVYDAYMKAKDKPAFRAKHEAELVIFEAAKTTLLTELRNESAISGSDTEDEFVGRTLDILSEFDEIEEPVRIGMGDKKGRGGRLMRADGYAFDETDHSLILLISDFQDSYSPENLNMSRVDELYWRLYYFLDESCNRLYRHSEWRSYPYPSYWRCRTYP